MAIHSYLAFLSVVAVVHFTPGPVMITLSVLTMNRGLKAGLLAFAGVEIAEILLISLVIYGFSSASSAIVVAMRWLSAAGVAYLVYAAISAWRARPDAPLSLASLKNNPLVSGFAVTMGDPISLLFYSALFPQFVNWQLPVASQLMTLAGCYFAFAIVFDVTLVLLSSCVPKMKGLKMMSAPTKKLANAVAASLIACIVVVAAVGNYVGVEKSASPVRSMLAEKDDLVHLAHVAHSGAGLAKLSDNQ
jgi:homoserine/homoserine lactone efflux protein